MFLVLFVSFEDIVLFDSFEDIVTPWYPEFSNNSYGIKMI